MAEPMQRRSFLELAASMVGVSSFGPRVRSQGLRGELLTDDSARAMAGDDWGREVRHLPVGVLRARSVREIVETIGYARARRLKIAMRGQGHSLCGQAQVAGGIVVDSSGLNAVRWRGDNIVEAEAGALWSDVARIALEHHRTPPVMPDALRLSVGGTLSVGGIGEASYRWGAQVDHALELDVVTGTGRLITCSPARNRELFAMALAGLGQCGIIVRARLRVVPAPEHVEVRALLYQEPDALLADLARLAASDVFQGLGGEATRRPDGGWQLGLFGTAFDSPPSSWSGGLTFAEEGPARTTDYWTHLDRRTVSVITAKQAAMPNPSLAVMLPEAAARRFVSHVLSTPAAAEGMWRLEVIPMKRGRFTQPLHVLPEGDLVFTVRLQRRASARNAADHMSMLSANVSLVRQSIGDGGKIYPPYAPILPPDAWRQHYGPATWRRFASAKSRFDPDHLLTPGAGVFPQP